ncbi:MAG: hypothetical protein PHI96_03595, partial [Desulfovibrio sp.]|nr:hypothetical protein [Desulfovibrio sp.]
GLNALGQPRSPATAHRAAPPELLAELARQSVAAKAFFDFTLLPVISPLPDDYMPAEAIALTAVPASPDTAVAPGSTHAANPVRSDSPAGPRRPAYALFYDLRFGSELAFVRAIMARRPNADVPFKYMTEMEPAAPGESATLGHNGQNPGDTRLVRERLRFSDSGKDSRWQSPRQPAPPSLWDWLIGMF